ncbi:MAG: DUF262 domain-containing protein [Sedimentisphaerales bacterium]|nr:DUF262 domain-containing protein [Sedimentisphaerales bacterium]
MSVVPQGKSVQALYRDYREGNLLVNRRYQRKLVWSVDEKRRLIDSIVRGYPIPLILLAERPSVHGKGRYEIVDGIQRFNAIFTFIENAFDYEGKYFDINEFTRAKQAAKDGAFEPVAGKRMLTPQECANILDYQLAVTIYPTTEDRNITDVFGRINSGGRQLSYQEQRQAGVVSAFAQLVRTLASELRGDVSKDILLLSEMPEISVDSTKEPHGYGIRAESTLWCRQGILSVKQLKDSEDEQIVADIAASVLKGAPLPISKELLDTIYDASTGEAKEIERDLVTYGEDRLTREIKATFSVLKQVIESCGGEPNFLRSTVRPGTFYPVKAPFYAIFMAFFDLVVKKQKSPDQPEKIMKALACLDEKLSKGGHYETTQNRETNISLTKGLIQDFFVDKVPPVLGHGPSLAIDFENALRRSRIETSRYEFKQGLLWLDEKRSWDGDLLGRLLETACGIANLGPSSEGYIFIGVADNREDVDRVRLLDHVEPRQIAHHFLVGIEREASRLKITVDDYVARIVQAFQNSVLSEPLKTQVMGGFDVITLNGLSAIRVLIPPQKDVSFVGGTAFSRDGSSTVKVEGPRLVAVTKLFHA